MKRIRLAAAVLFATTTMAMAQEKVQISYSGVLSFERNSDSNSFPDYFYGNGDVSFRWSTVNDVRFGADIGVETFKFFNTDNRQSLSAYYVAGVVEGRFGRISIGMPRSAMDQYFTIPKLGGSEIGGLDFAAYGGIGLFRVLKLTSPDESGDFYGARYDGKIGQIEFAAYVSKQSDLANIEEMVAHYDAGHWSATLGTTRFEMNGYSGNGTNLEVQGQAGQLSGGIVLSKSDAEAIGGDAVRAFVSYEVNEAVKLNTQVVRSNMNENQALNFYAFDVSYNHKTGAFVNAGVLGGDTLSDKCFNVSLGYKF